ncbi:hypothetical protein MACH17_40740 [Phaeobacter inhibens]|nr:hypothetical protein MACH17_40740 [Phaeobacter inhibens]
MKAGGNFPQTLVSWLLTVQMPMPLGCPTQKTPGLIMLRAALDQCRRFYERRGNLGTFHIQKAQHSRNVAPESVVTLNNMSNRIRRQSVGQSRGDGDQFGQPVPTQTAFDRFLRRNAILFGFQQGGTQIPERSNGLLNCRFGILNPRRAKPLPLAPCLPDDPIMGLNNRV